MAGPLSESLVVKNTGGPRVYALPEHLHVRTFGIVIESCDKRLGVRSATVPGRGAREQRQPHHTRRGHASRQEAPASQQSSHTLSATVASIRAAALRRKTSRACGGRSNRCGLCVSLSTWSNGKRIVLCCTTLSQKNTFHNWFQVQTRTLTHHVQQSMKIWAVVG